MNEFIPKFYLFRNYGYCRCFDNAAIIPQNNMIYPRTQFIQTNYLCPMQIRNFSVNAKMPIDILTISMSLNKD